MHAGAVAIIAISVLGNCYYLAQCYYQHKRQHETHQKEGSSRFCISELSKSMLGIAITNEKDFNEIEDDGNLVKKIEW